MPRRARPPRNAAEAEQREITRQLLATVDVLRSAQGLSIERLAARAGLSLGFFIYARRHHHDLALSQVLRLCRGLGVGPDELLGELPLPTVSLRTPEGSSRA